MAIETKAAVEVRKKLTPDDVAEMVETGQIDTRAMFFELVDGELIALPPGGPEHNWDSLDIATALHAFARSAGGQAFGDGAGFKVGAGHRQLRSPDAAYLGPERALKPPYPTWIDGAPDLAVEVLSPDQYGEAYAKGKVREYFDAGAQLVWLVDRRLKEVRVFRNDSDDIVIMRGEAILTLEPIVAGFALKVADIFR